MRSLQQHAPNARCDVLYRICSAATGVEPPGSPPGRAVPSCGGDGATAPASNLGCGGCGGSAAAPANRSLPLSPSLPGYPASAMSTMRVTTANTVDPTTPASISCLRRGHRFIKLTKTARDGRWPIDDGSIWASNPSRGGGGQRHHSLCARGAPATGTRYAHCTVRAALPCSIRGGRVVVRRVQQRRAQQPHVCSRNVAGVKDYQLAAN